MLRGQRPSGENGGNAGRSYGRAGNEHLGGNGLRSVALIRIFTKVSADTPRLSAAATGSAHPRHTSIT